jgi:hypothetical protein
LRRALLLVIVSLCILGKRRAKQMKMDDQPGTIRSKEMTMEAQSSVYMNTEAAAIDDLVISDKLKEKFHLIREHCKGVKLGFPEYDMQTFQFRLKMMSIWAVVFGAFYYLAKGMYKKGAVLFGISLILLGLSTVHPWLQYIGIMVPILASHCAYSDLYRTYVLKENFWW